MVEKLSSLLFGPKWRVDGGILEIDPVRHLEADVEERFSSEPEADGQRQSP